jgi:hypothetical protein
LIQVNATFPPARQPAAVKSEEKIVTGEFYYLALVVGSFVAFMVGVGWSMIEYRAWVKRTGQHVQSAE